ncbi:MAG TPA: helicase C-terminal domain-containing protein, partial [Ruminococcus bromii]
ELHIVDVEPTELQKELVDELSDRADEVNSGSVDPSQDNMLKITGDGRKLGLDPRLISPDFEDDPNTKLNVCVNNVFDIYTDTAKDKLTQIVFCDLGVPSKNTGNDSSKEQNDNKSVAELDSLEETGKFCVYDDIRDKLIAKGIPATEIAYIHNAKTEAQKSELFSKVRSGEVRILLGSTGKMGTGTNVQDRIIALHDLDVPWRPADLEQRRGRMV